MSNPNKSFVQLAEKEQQAVNYVFTIKFCMVRLGRAKGRSEVYGRKLFLPQFVNRGQNEISSYLGFSSFNSK